MSNAVVKTGNAGALTALSRLASGNPFLKLGSELNISTGAFLKYSGDTGKFSYKGKEIEHGTLMAFNLMEAKKGWICWKDGKPVEQVMVGILSGEPMLAEHELTDHGPYKQGDGWRQQLSVVIRDLEGGEQMDLNLSNISGRNALGQLLGEFGAKVAMNVDTSFDPPEPMVPIVEIGAVSFTPKNAAGKKWAPQFKLVDWRTQAELNVLSGIDDDEADAEPVEAAIQQPAPAAAARPAGFRGMRRG